MKFGLIYWGLPTGILYTLFMYFLNDSSIRPEECAISITVFALAGFFIYGPILHWFVRKKLNKKNQY